MSLHTTFLYEMKKIPTYSVEQVKARLLKEIHELSLWLMEKSDGVSRTHYEKAKLLQDKLEEYQKFEAE